MYIQDLQHRHARRASVSSATTKTLPKADTPTSSLVRTDSFDTRHPTGDDASHVSGETAVPRREYLRARSLNEIFPLVVSFQRRWCEIACFVCSANRPKNGARCFRGWPALRQHIMLTHEEEYEANSDVELLAACIKRHFRRADVHLMKDGKEPEEGGPIVMVRKARTSNPTQPSTSKQKESNVAEDEIDDNDGEDDVNIPTRRRRSAVAASHGAGSYQEQDESAERDIDEEAAIDESDIGIDFDEDVSGNVSYVAATQVVTPVATMSAAPSKVPTEAHHPTINHVDPDRDPRRKDTTPRGSFGTPSSYGISHTASQQHNRPSFDTDARLAAMARAYADDSDDDIPLRRVLAQSSSKSSGSPPYKKRRQVSGYSVQATERRDAISGPSSTEPTKSRKS